MPRLSARDVVIQYGADAPPALAGLTLELLPGSLIGVVGPNGAGKSTLVRALSRTLAPRQGVVRLWDRDLYRDVSARAAAREIAVVPQDTTTAFDFSVREVVEMGRGPRLPRHPFAALSAADNAAVQSALEQAGVANLAERAVTELSGGERQRVLFARALAQEGDVLLLDEPTAHLDLRHQWETLALARDLAQKQGRAALAVLHDLNLAAAHCDKLIVMSAGQIAAQGTPEEALTAQMVQSVYGARVWVRRHPITGRPYIIALPETTEVQRGGVVLVLCGGGTGAAVMDGLQRRGMTVIAGALNAGDPDAEAAAALGVNFPREVPFSPLSAKSLAETEYALVRADGVLVTNLPIGPTNIGILEIARSAQRAHKAVVCVDSPGASLAQRDFTGGAAAKLWNALKDDGAVFCDSDEAAVTALTDRLKYAPHDAESASYGNNRPT